jgi:hypothetical protein
MLYRRHPAGVLLLVAQASACVPFSKISKTQSKETSMPSLSPKDRVSLCLFSFTDGRRCRTPRTGNHPHFCFYHAQKEVRAQAAESLAKDVACFFSGDYLTACDLSTALSRLIPAVIRGDMKPRLARTVAYMMQGLIQTVHLAKDEYINAFGTDGWRKAIRTSVNANYDHRFPTAPEPDAEQPTPPAPPQIQTQPPTPAQVPPQSPAQPAPPTSVGAGLARPERTSHPSSSVPAPTSVSERLQPAPSMIATQPNQPNTANPLTPPRPQPRPDTPRDPYAVHFDHNYRLRIDGKPF